MDARTIHKNDCKRGKGKATIRNGVIEREDRFPTSIKDTVLGFLGI
jgi:hypothetical protein